MKLIKAYLLPLVLSLFLAVSSFAQTDTNLTAIKMSKTDSILVNCYFSEQDYNAIYQIETVKEAKHDAQTYEDEIYSNQKHKKRNKNTFWENIPAELVADVVVNVIFLVALLWQ